MNSIPNAPGVYILVLYLSQTTTITFNRKSSQHSFPSGWYVYVGSARGPGGLSRRVARHQRRNADGKRMHWNVDYFRELAPIVEVWYSYTRSEQMEHEWASAVSSMHGATVPVQGFGANDCRQCCSAHFFHFIERPATSLFRSRLRDLIAQQPSVFVEFADDALTAMTVSKHMLFVEYHRGRRFTELRYLAIAQSDLDVTSWHSLAKRRPARQLADRVAAQLDVPFQELKKAIEFAEAVETIVGNCGNMAFRVLFDPMRPQRRKGIMELSRTADTRQQYRIDGVTNGSFRSVGPQSKDSVYDTIAFTEVPSRLARARGAIHQLDVHLQDGVKQRIATESDRLADLCLRAAEQLGKFVNAVSAADHILPRELAKEVVWPTLMSRDVKGKIVGYGREALRLTIKSVWDYPEMRRRGILPTASERRKVNGEAEQIIASAKSVRVAVLRQRNVETFE